jgi:hypothetical protein
MTYVFLSDFCLMLFQHDICLPVRFLFNVVSTWHMSSCQIFLMLFQHDICLPVRDAFLTLFQHDIRLPVRFFLMLFQHDICLPVRPFLMLFEHDICLPVRNFFLCCFSMTYVFLSETYDTVSESPYHINKKIYKLKGRSIVSREIT